MIELTKVVGLATIQDGGRPGFMHAGIPQGGALVPELLARANGSVQNAPFEAAIEVLGAITVVARTRVTIGTDDGTAIVLDRGAQTEIATPRNARVRYLAIRGAFDVPLVLGSKATLLVAGLGGLDGRALRKGDVLVAGDAIFEDPVLPVAEEIGKIRVIPGPDLEAFDPNALERLLGEPFTISTASDRSGTRLVGQPLLRANEDTMVTRPMVRGAIEVTAGGEAIVLGPDHPTTGGYPVLACVTTRDFGRLMRMPLGGTVRFRADAR
jgi:biotin-dependent carboxylase-like uncharacterized protein